MKHFESHKYQDGDCHFKDIQVGEIIGSGNSRVFDVIFKKKPAAMKQVIIKNQEQAQDVANEIKIMKSLAGNECIIKYYGSFNTIRQIDQYNQTKITYIVMEKAALSLEQFLQYRIKERKIFTESEVIKIMKSLINTLSILEKQKIAHCDIKPQNILIMNADTLDVKLCDIGSSRMTKEATQEATFAGTVPFLAPELVKDFSKNRFVHNPYKSDAFSLGLCLIYLLIFKKFKSSQRLKTNEDTYKQIIHDWILQGKQHFFNNEILSFILNKTLQFDVKARSNFLQMNKQLKQKILTYQLEKSKITRNNLKKRQTLYLEKRKKSNIFINNSNLNSSFQNTIRQKRSDNSLRHTNSFAFRTTRNNALNTVLNPIPQAHSTAIIKRKVVLRKIQIASRSASRRKTSPGSALRKTSSNMKQTTLTTQSSSPLIKIQSLNSVQDLNKYSIILINNDNMLIIQNNMIDWQNKLVILDNCYENIDKINEKTIKLSQKSDQQVIINNLKQSESLKSIVIDFKQQSSKQSFNFLTFEMYKGIQSIIILLDFSNIQNYKRLFQVWITLNLKKVQISLNNSKVGFEDIQNFVISQSSSNCLESLSLNLKQLKIIKQKQNKMLMEGINKLKQLKFLKLNFSNNNMQYTKQHPWYLPKKLEKLILLYSNNNLLCIINNISLSLTIVKYSLKILILDFSYTKLSSKQVNFLFNSITKLQLETLSLKLKNNHLDDSAAKYISKNINLLFTLKSLELGLENNNILLESFVGIVKAVDKMFEGKLENASLKYNRWASRQKISNKISESIRSDIKINYIFHDTIIKIFLLTKKHFLRQTFNKPLFCQKLHPSSETIAHYLCITCIDKNPIYKNIYLCSFCKQSSDHFNHNMVLVYEDIQCQFSYLKSSPQINQLPCSNPQGVIFQKSSSCLQCEKSCLCLGCIKPCKDKHPDMVKENKTFGKFKCQGIKQNKS